MAKTAIQVFGWVLSMGSWGATVGVLLSHKWKITTVEGNQHSVLDSVTYIEGLWNSCQTYPTGQTKCTPFSGPLSTQPPLVVVCRALLLFAVLVGAVAGVLGLIGFKCTELGPDTRKHQAQVFMTAGLLLFVCGICVTGATSYYMYDVINASFLIGPTNVTQPYQIHEAAKISLAFGLLWLVGSLIMMCGSRHHQSLNDVTHGYKHKETVQEYV